MKYIIYFILTVGFLSGTYAHDDGDPRMLVLRGEYTAVGIGYETGKPYRGSVTLHYGNSEFLSVSRTINGKTVTGSGKIVRKPPSEIDEFSVTFEENGRKYSALYMIQTDHDNYFRLTGYIFRIDVNEPDRGFEALFPKHE